MKTCTKCSIPKPESDFYVRPDTGGLCSRCKICVCKAHEAKNRESPELRRKANAKWYAANRIQVLEEKANNKSHSNQQRRRRYASDLRYKLTCLLRGRVTSALAGKTKRDRTFELFGCPIVWLEVHLESLFVPGMSWENYGPVWHIDHKRPCASFDLTDPEQQKMCFHWTNLQPLFAAENISKGAKYDPQNA